MCENHVKTHSFENHRFALLVDGTGVVNQERETVIFKTMCFYVFLREFVYVLRSNLRVLRVFACFWRPRAVLLESVNVLLTSLRVSACFWRVLATFGRLCVRLRMLCAQVRVVLRVFTCFGARWAILRASVHVLRTSLRVLRAFSCFWRPSDVFVCVCGFVYVLRTVFACACLCLRVGVLRPSGYVA